MNWEIIEEKKKILYKYLTIRVYLVLLFILTLMFAAARMYLVTFILVILLFLGLILNDKYKNELLN